MKTIIKMLPYGEWLWTNNPETDQVYVRDCLDWPQTSEIEVKITWK